jgi:hypothetical protein
MGKILAWIGTYIVRNLGVLFTSWKMYLGYGLLLILFVYVYNFWVDACKEIYDLYTAQVQAMNTPGGAVLAYQATGLAGYLVAKFKIPECGSFIVSIIMLKWAARKIPFIRW